MGRIGFAVVGGFLILNSYLFLWLLPGQTFAAELCAFIGAVILAFPIILTAVKDLCEGRVYMNELVALAILAAFTSADFREAFRTHKKTPGLWLCILYTVVPPERFCNQRPGFFPDSSASLPGSSSAGR